MKTTPDWQFAPENAPEQWAKAITLARMGAVLSGITVLTLVIAPLARVFLDIAGITAFLIFYYALLAGLILAVLGLAGIVFATFKKINTVRKHGAMMLILGVLPVISLLILLGPDKLGSPMIHDITTDTVTPPEFIEARKLRTRDENPLEYRDEERPAIQDKFYPDIGPIISGMNREEALFEVTRTVKDLGWEFINVDFDNGIIEAYDTTRVFGFVDDIVIRVREENTGSRIDIRSVSRVGKGDLGKNAERIRAFIRTFRP